MKVGFTGTRKGMSQHQLRQIDDVLLLLTKASELLSWPKAASFELHVGGADGADTEAIAQTLLALVEPEQIVVHPCPGVTVDKLCAKLQWYQLGVATRFKWREVFPPLVRDRNIAEEIDLLIAAPETDKEVVRSGTWATIRYTRAQVKPVIQLSRG